MAEKLKEKDATWVPQTPATRDTAKTAHRAAKNVGFDSLPLHGKSESKNVGMSDSPKMGCTNDAGASSRKPRKGVKMKRHRPKVFDESKTLKSQTSSERERMKKHRPKVFDESKNLKPSTPKPRTPKPARNANKKVVPSKNDDGEAISGCSKRSCKRKLDFDKEICTTGRKNLKSRDEISDVSDRKLRSSNRITSLRVYGAVDSAKIFKKRRMMRQRMSLDKLIRLLRMIHQKYMSECVSTVLSLDWMYLKRRRSNIITRRRDISSFLQTDLEAQDEGIQNVAAEKSIEHCENPQDNMVSCNVDSLPTHVEVQDEGIQHLAAKKSVEHCKNPEDDVVSYNGDSLPTHVEVQDEGIQDLAAEKSVEQCKTHQDDVVSYNGDSLPTHVEVEDEGIQDLAAEKSVEQCKNQQDDMVSCNGDFLRARVEVQDEGFQHIAAEKSVEHCRNPQNDVVSCNGDVQNSSAEFLDHKREAETDILERDLEFNTSFQQQQEEIMDLSNEEGNVLSIQDDVFKQALVDFATQKIESLQIDDRSKQLVVRDQYSHGAIVPSKERTDPHKYRKPKVDIDEENAKMWKLLMEKKGGESTEEIGIDKAYWKEQKEALRIHVKHFMEVLRLFLGERKFSRWKGSVVDSVVGVFLTQNVSDNLSSSAFIALAAKYPPPSVSEQKGCDDQSNYITNETQQVEIDEVKLENIGDETFSATEDTPASKMGKVKNEEENRTNWDDLRKQYSDGVSKPRPDFFADSVDWEAVRKAPVEEVAKVIENRGMNNTLARKIKDFLDRLVRDHGSIDLEWLRDVPPDKSKDYLMSIAGLGLKSTECVRLLSLHIRAFPIDTNAGRALVRLGIVPLQPLPEDVLIHLLNDYPELGSIQKFMWPRMCDFDHPILYEYHCLLIVFSKAFCTKTQPNCNACPLRGECKHYASALASSRLRVEGSQAKDTAPEPSALVNHEAKAIKSQPMLTNYRDSEPIVEFPASPEPASTEPLGGDIEDFGYEFEIPTLILNSKEFSENRISLVHDDDDDIRKALVALNLDIASIPMPKLKHVERLRTVHQVYELPDSHPLLAGFEKRELEDPNPYLLAIWTADESTDSSQESKKACNCQDSTTCNAGTCYSGEIVQYQKDEKVQATILIPCRTANRGSFPLNGTYFQNNEVFADHESSRRPIDVPREWIWNLRRRALYCGTSITSICRGMSLKEITYCFRKGFICIRGFDVQTRAARSLAKRFHVCKTRQTEDES